MRNSAHTEQYFIPAAYRIPAVSFARYGPHLPLHISLFLPIALFHVLRMGFVPLGGVFLALFLILWIVLFLMVILSFYDDLEFPGAFRVAGSARLRQSDFASEQCTAYTAYHPLLLSTPYRSGLEFMLRIASDTRSWNRQDVIPQKSVSPRSVPGPHSCPQMNPSVCSDSANSGLRVKKSATVFCFCMSDIFAYPPHLPYCRACAVPNF